MDTAIFFNKPFPNGNIIRLITKLNITSRVLVVLLGLLINNGFSKTPFFSGEFEFENDSTKGLKLPLGIPDSLKNDSVVNDEISKDAPSFPVKYIANDSIDFDNHNQIVYLYGQAKVQYDKISLEADRIKVYIGKNEVHAFCKRDSATGKILEKVIFNDDGESFEAPEMKYNFNTKKGRIIQATTQEGEMYLLSDVGKKMPNNDIFLEKGKITTCDHEHPHFYFEAKKLKVIPGKKVVVGPTNLVIRELRTPIWVPFGIFPNNQKRKSGILIPGYGQRDGYFGLDQLGFHWAINDFIHAEFLTNIYFSGTSLFTAELKYKKKYKFNGQLRFRYNNVVQGTKDLADYSITRDFNIGWTFNQDPKAHPKSSFKISIDAKSPTFNQTQNLNSATAISSVQGQNNSQVSWGWTDKKWSLTTTSSLNQNFAQNRVSMTLPNANLSVRAKKWKLLGLEGTLAGSAQARNSVTMGDSTFFTNETFENFRNGAKSNVNMRITKRATLFKYLNITLPYVNWNSYLMTEQIQKVQAESGLSNDTIDSFRYAYDLSLGNVGLNTKIFGTYKFKEGMYVKGFRHTITPSVNLTYSPDFFIEAQDINQVALDTVTGKTVEYSRYETSIFKPNASKAARINFSLDQNLQSKIKDLMDSTGLGSKKINIINAFRLNTSYNFLADSLNWSDLSFSLNTAPVFLKNLNISGNFSPYEIDEFGLRYNSLIWEKGELGRLTSFRAQTSVSLNRNQFVGWLFGLKDQKKDDFGWNMNINYTYTYNKPTFDVTTNQSLGLGGNVNLTENWKFNYNLPINMESYTFARNGYINFTRGLHCWEMSTNWFPFREDVWFTFSIQPKAGLLRDLKYDRKKQGSNF